MAIYPSYAVYNHLTQIACNCSLSCIILSIISKGCMSVATKQTSFFFTLTDYFGSTQALSACICMHIAWCWRQEICLPITYVEVAQIVIGTASPLQAWKNNTSVVNGTRGIHYLKQKIISQINGTCIMEMIVKSINFRTYALTLHANFKWYVLTIVILNHWI